MPPRRPRHPRYQILRRLGSGGAGSVYLARDRLDDGREVALKVSHLEVSPEQILGEFRILRELRHPGIARAHDFGRLPGGGATYFTLEHVQGPNFEKLIPELRRKWRAGDRTTLVGVFLQILSALEYLHRRGLLHLDLKPANIVVSDRRVKLIDFGIFQNACLHGARVPCGTPRYTAPEILHGGPFDARADLYSLGVTMFRAFTGRYPFPESGRCGDAARHGGTRLRLPRGFPAELGAVIVKLLAKFPRQRFQSVEEVGKALRAVHPDPESIAPAPFAGVDLVGRKRELDAFFTWLDRLGEASGPRLCVVEGEAGIGKSRFVECCITEMLGIGVNVVSLRAFRGRDRDGLRRLVEKVLALRFHGRQQRPRHAFLLTSMGLLSDAAALEELGRLDLEQIRARVFTEAMALVRECICGPCVLVLEDLHLADSQLRDFVRRFAAAPVEERSGLPGMLVSTRSENVRDSGDVGGDGAAGDGGEPRRIKLFRLRHEEVIEAIEGLSASPASRVTARLARRSRGIPGLLVHLLERELAGDRTPASRSRSADLGTLVRERLGGLSGDELATVMYLGLLGRPADEELLGELTALSAARVRDTTHTLERLGLLGGNRAGYYLEHGLLEDDITGRVTPGESRAAHARIGLRLLVGPGPHGEAAQHLFRGGRIRKALEVARHAVDELHASGRVEEALALASAALEHARGPAARHFLEARGELLDKSGQFDEAGKSYDLLLEDTRLPVRVRARILRKRGGISQRQGSSEPARRCFEEALELLERVNDFEEHLDLLNELAALYLFRGEFPRSTSFANRGLEMLESRRAARLRPEVHAYHALNFHSVAGHILLRQFEYERSVEEFQRGLKFSESIGSLSNTALILNNLGIAYHQSNRLRDALRVYSRADALARQMGDDTAHFSIQCNVATIRARQGAVRQGRGIFDAIEEMPHTHRSTRARLFFLHSRGLLERLALEDARGIWEESIRLATTLQDPLFRSYGRVYLLENEIYHGRWASARQVLGDLRHCGGDHDTYLDRAVTSRQAYLEALCGNRETARALVDDFLRTHPLEREGSSRPAYGALWDGVIVASALLELGDLDAGERILRTTKRCFDRTRQPPGSLECALLLAEVSLRRRDRDAAARWIQESRRASSLHDDREGTRSGASRIPFLEARLALLQSGKAAASQPLAEAAGNLPHGASMEIVWLVDLVGREIGESGTRGRLTVSRRRFLGGLSAADRKSYEAIDQRTRLGLVPSEAVTPGNRAEATRERTASSRLDALMQLRALREPDRALEIIMEGAGARRGAIFLADRPPVAASRGFGSKARTELAGLRRAALRVGTGAWGRGLCAEIRHGHNRRGILYVEVPGERRGSEKDELTGFLDLAAQTLGVLLDRVALWPADAPEAPDSTPVHASRGTVQTRTLNDIGFMESQSPRMQELLTLLRRTRESKLPVLLTGESGVGKDHLARWIHGLGPRRRKPFVGQDVSAIPVGLLEAELFGHEVGAFTGASRARKGLFLAADGGTFYFDNVDSLSLDVQATMLKVLQEERVRPLGSRASTKIAVRFIASTRRDLKKLVARGEFRDDLYFRLAGICLNVPRLCERAEDIPLLIRHFQRQTSGGGPEFTAAALEVLAGHAWPGNVRELESVVRRFALTAEGPIDRDEVLRVLGLAEDLPAFPRWIFEGREYDQLLQDIKREYLLYLFDRVDGDFDRIARELGTTKRNAYLKFSQVGLRPVDLRRFSQRG